MPGVVRIAPPYSLIFVSDVDGGASPECTGGKSLWATPSCIAVGVFDGVLETPSKAVIISTAEHETVMNANVPTQSTRVRIWTNHPTEPDRIIVGLG